MMDYYDYPPRRRQPSASPRAVFGGMLVVIAATAVVLWILGVYPFGRHGELTNPNVKPREAVARTDRNPDEIERISIYKATKPSVVNVETRAFGQRGILSDEEIRLGTGAGFIWDDQGRIVTNFHVVRNVLAQQPDGTYVVDPDHQIVVMLASGETIPASLVNIAPSSDLAVIKLNSLPAGGVKKIAVGSSDDLEVGQTVFAIGSPFGQPFSLTQGIISALGRRIQSPTEQIISDVIQTDASLNPGNSGGPLLDKDGRLIGVNTAITSPSGGSVGIGYAIPVNTVNQVVTELIRGERSPQPYLGAVYYKDEEVRRAGLSRGVVVRDVKPRSPAAAGGLQPLDIITKVNGVDINGLADLQRVQNNMKVGDTLTFTVRRQRQVLDLTIHVDGI